MSFFVCFVETFLLFGLLGFVPLVSLLSALRPAERVAASLYFAPLAGMSLVLLWSAWTVGLGHSLHALPSVVSAEIFLSFGILFFVSVNRNKHPTSASIFGHRNSGLILGCVLLLIAAFVIITHPLWRIPYLTTVMRLGPDGAMYGQMAQFLKDGGRLSDLSHPPTLTLAIAGFLIHLRWGCPLLVGAVASILHVSHAYQVLFQPSLIALLMSAGFVFLWLQKVSVMPLWCKGLGAAAFLLNANLLNALFENQHPNVLALPLIAGLAWWVSTWRQAPKVDRTMITSLLLASLLCLSVLVIYSEIVPILIVVGFLMTVIDLLQREFKRAVVTAGTVTLVGLSALVLTGPYGLKLVDHLRHLSLTNVGYPQPLWALPSEIIGLSNIYEPHLRWLNAIGQPILIHRHAFSLIFNILASLGIVWVTIDFLAARRDGKDTAFWMSWVAALVLIVGLSLFGHRPNYLYMKTYLTFLPMGFPLAWASIWHFSSQRLSARHTGLVLVALALAMARSGVSYLADYERTSQHVPLGLMTLHASAWNPSVVLLPKPRGEGDFRRRYLDRTKEGYLAILLQPLWVDQWLEGMNLSENDPAKDLRVALLLDGDDRLSVLKQTPSSLPILFQDGEEVILDTAQPLRAGLQFKNGSIEAPHFDVFWNAIKNK